MPSGTIHRSYGRVRAFVMSAVAVTSLLPGAAVAAGARGTVVPTDGMVIIEDTVFEPGTYNLPNGVSIGASIITLDMNGAELVGSFTEDGDPTYGVTSIGFDNVTILNGVVNGYYYGMRIEDASSVEISDCNLSGNWVDPDSLNPGAPFLNINVGPDLGDTVNLGGGLFMNNITGGIIASNTMTGQENGIDLYNSTGLTVSNNECSGNTGWGIHLHASTGNTIESNDCDDCIRDPLGDSAGMLLVYGSHENDILNNTFRGGGDGFFIGNEHGCPSNDNFISGNDGSNAGANAFEATFSSGNRFHDNIASGSNYGFWLGYSHSGNEIVNNAITANNANGIEIEHGQDNLIQGNTISGNGGSAIVLRTDGIAHFPPEQFPCLELPNQEASSGYTATDNVITLNLNQGFELTNTTDSTITNNLVGGNGGGNASSNGANVVWSIDPTPGENIVGGPNLGGNYWDNYEGEDLDDDGLGDTDLPYTNGGAIALPGDEHPLIGDPDIGSFENPRSLCARRWVDLGRNTREDGSNFDTTNGTHYGTDGTDLYLLESMNSDRFSLFDPATNRYIPKANLPEAVWDGGGLQYADGFYYAGVGIQLFNDKGERLYRYDPNTNMWDQRADAIIDDHDIATESFAYDPVNNRLYATIVDLPGGADPALKRKLAIYDIDTDTWLGATSDSGVEFGAGSEAEYLDGKVYCWRGLFAGGAVNGSDSFLNVYDVASDTWSTTPTLQDSGVIFGFRSGPSDVWGVNLTSDAARKRIFVQGGEGNKQIYIFDVDAQQWTVAPQSIYDGGWGAALEYVAASDRLYQLDGRTQGANEQGTAYLSPPVADLNDDGVVNVFDLLDLLAVWGPCEDTCCPADLDENGFINVFDLLILLAAWG